MSNSSIYHIVELFHSSSSLQLLLKPFARNSVFRHDLQWQIAHLLNSIPVYKSVIGIIENYWCFNHYKRCQGLIFGIEILKSHHNSASCVFSCDVAGSKSIPVRDLEFETHFRCNTMHSSFMFSVSDKELNSY